MIYSMTGYAVATKDHPFGTLNLELRSVNHRYLDMTFRMPEEFRAFEPPMREALSAKLTRGKLECRLGYTRAAAAPSVLDLNEQLLERLVQLNHQVRIKMPQARDLTVNDVLRWPGMFGAETLPLDELREVCMGMLNTALADFSATRGREGEKLKAMLIERTEKMEALALAVAPKVPQIVAAQQEKLTQRVKEVVTSVDEERIRQEIVMFASRVDVDEELSRLQTHLKELRRILDKGGAVGKRLDFLMQELNREANTLGSKSVDVEMSQTSMEMKVLIEQMREQVQNIE